MVLTSLTAACGKERLQSISLEGLIAARADPPREGRRTAKQINALKGKEVKDPALCKPRINWSSSALTQNRLNAYTYRYIL